MSHVSITNRRIVLLAVMSLIASLVVVASYAPAARADNEVIEFDLTSSTAISEDAGTVDVDINVAYDVGTFVAEHPDIDPNRYLFMKGTMISVRANR